ncbi:MAG: tandem-95 repeat protein, partial [candidate division Zixibacteria bacterium]|nr:tandem-95 repeat protein [candidate division Zixibacteria bacterium]
QSLNFVASATDPDGTIPTLSAENVPVNATFTNNGNGTGTFTFNPDFTQSGVYNVRIIASDGTLADSEVVAVTVNNVNRNPVLAAIGSQSVNEGQNLTFGLSATDPDGTVPTFSVQSPPANSVLTDNGNGTATFVFNPDFTQSGVYNVRFIASDGSLTDSELVTITVNNVNRAPVLATIGAQSVNEGQNLNFGTSATDPDGIFPSLTAQSVPSNATFTDNGNGTGTFNFNPDFTQSGVYNVRFIASDGSLSDTELVAITVNNVNRNPVLAAIGAKSVNEGQTLNFGLSASDPDCTTPTFAVENSPLNATLSDNGNGTATYVFNPDFTQAGVYNVRFICSDGVLTDSEVVAITVNNVNRAPVLASIGAKSVVEGGHLQFRLSATDPDGAIPVLTALSVPLNATFRDSLNGAGSFIFDPDFTQTGVYNVTFIASDGTLADSEVVTITVSNTNLAPVLAAIGAQSVAEGAHLQFRLSATDPDGTIPTLTALNVPTNATFRDSLNGAGSLVFDPDYTQAGVYNVTFIASDGSLADSEIVPITVTNTNRPPVLAAIGAKSVAEGAHLQFRLSASDPDGNIPTLSALNVPTNATFRDSLNGAGSLIFDPDFTQAGVYNVTFIASDGTLADSEIVAITVTNTNRAPVLAPIGSKSVNEGQNLNFIISASDPDATIPVLTAENVPANATFTNNGNGAGTFDFNPDFTQAGVYNVRFIASDGALADSEIVAITVNNVNQPPVLAPIGAQSVAENAHLQFRLTASDPDGTIPSLSALNVPANATFRDSLNGAGSLVFDPDFTQAGVYNVTFIASDGSSADSEIVAITVTNVNAPPILAPIGARFVTEGTHLEFRITASDVDPTIPVLTALGVPTNAVFTDSLNGAGSFVFNPDFTQAGVYNVTFIASDGSLADSELVLITVTNSNRTPVANAGPDQGPIALGALVHLSGLASSDLDGDSLHYHWLQIAGTAVVLSDSTAAGPTFTPAIGGVHRFTLRVDDGQAISAPDTVDVTAVSSPRPIADLLALVSGNAIQLSWSTVTLDTSGAATTLARYVVYRGTRVYFTPTAAESIGVATAVAVSFLDNNTGGADVVGDTGTNYFYCLIAVDVAGGRSRPSNRAGEYDYQIYTTSTTDFTLIMMPFAGTGIATASDLIQAIGTANVNTLNRFVAASQSYESRFAAGFGPNFPIVPGGIYQVNAKSPTVFTVAGRVPDSGGISYPIVTTSTTDFSFIGVPFERELDFTTAQSVIDAIPGVLNTLNRFIPASQSYESRFATGFGPNFPVKAGRPYQANAKIPGVFPPP